MNIGINFLFDMMYSIMKLFSFINLIMIFFAFSVEASSGMSIAVIDKDYIFSQALSIKNIKNHMDFKELELQKMFSVKKDELNKISDDLNKQKDIISSDVFNKRVDDLNKLAISFQQEISNKKLELDDSYSSYLDIVYNKLKEISNRLANENGLSLILFLSKAEHVFYADINIDISNKVVDILNKELPIVIKNN